MCRSVIDDISHLLGSLLGTLSLFLPYFYSASLHRNVLCTASVFVIECLTRYSKSYDVAYMPKQITQLMFLYQH